MPDLAAIVPRLAPLALSGRGPTRSGRGGASRAGRRGGPWPRPSRAFAARSAVKVRSISANSASSRNAMRPMPRQRCWSAAGRRTIARRRVALLHPGHETSQPPTGMRQQRITLLRPFLAHATHATLGDLGLAGVRRPVTVTAIRTSQLHWRIRKRRYLRKQVARQALSSRACR